ncbi:hypothetical protein RAS1_10300 [Phycisphaerae bacterium RAS1]|nr:hypothetical protein RAS1_10300 [Phycisphaerae bacterium RAS1]
MAQTTPGTTPIPGPLLPLPILGGEVIRIIGPRAADAPTAVRPFIALGEPLGVVQTYLGALCSAAGQILRLVELTLVFDPAAAAPAGAIPHGDGVAALVSATAVLNALPAAFRERQVIAIADERPIPPLLYCRKRNMLFAARSPATLLPLSSPKGEPAAAAHHVPPALICCDAAPDAPPTKIYAFRSGDSTCGPTEGFERLILDQGGVALGAARLAEADPQAADALAAAHACVRCSERPRCYPAGGYAYVQDRLTVVHAAEAPLRVAPLAEWRLSEAAAFVGGAAMQKALLASHQDSPLKSARLENAAVIDAWGPARLLTGETDGRELLEIARLRLNLMAEVLAQLDAAWLAAKRSHLCWDDDAVRVTWRPPPHTPAAAWGFEPVLRRIGLQPATTILGEGGAALPYPPAYSKDDLFPAEIVEAKRSFGQQRPATFFAKEAKTEALAVRAGGLLEDTGIAFSLFQPGDVIQISGPGWEATLGPTGVHNPDDGAGAAVRGLVQGDVAAVKAGQPFRGCAMRWYPLFHEATDLLAFGALLIETLVGTDERLGPAFRGALAAGRTELTSACLSVPAEQREAKARAWITGVCTNDSSGDIWSRRNLLYRRESRSAAHLNALPGLLWQALVTYCLRLATSIPGFSYCDHRALPAPRMADGQLVPLLELRGLIALLDDQLFGRSQPAEWVRETLRPKRPTS